jgi:hypothetical protein
MISALRLRRSAGTAFVSVCSVVVTIVLVDGAFRCGRGDAAFSACVGCDLPALGADADGVASTACFDGGLLTVCGGAAGVASADGVEAGGIVMAGFFAAGACF